MTKKYVVWGGMIRSRRDGERHYVDPIKVMSLYKVNPKECVILPENAHEGDYADLIELHPRDDGDYRHIRLSKGGK